MLKNSAGNVMVISDLSLQQQDVNFGLTVYPDLDSYTNGLNAFQKTVSMRGSFDKTFRDNLKTVNGDSATPVEDTIKNTIEDEIVSVSSGNPQTFSIDQVVVGDWIKA